MLLSRAIFIMISLKRKTEPPGPAATAWGMLGCKSTWLDGKGHVSESLHATISVTCLSLQTVPQPPSCLQKTPSPSLLSPLVPGASSPLPFHFSSSSAAFFPQFSLIIPSASIPAPSSPGQNSQSPCLYFQSRSTTFQVPETSIRLPTGRSPHPACISHQHRSSDV